MKKHFTIKKTFLSWLVVLTLTLACVERIEFDIPPARLQIVVEGNITSDPGPYTVKVSEGISLDANSPESTPIEGLKIDLYDSEGAFEAFTETAPGTYQTGGFIQGEVGHSYYIRIETTDGKIYESVPDTIEPVGEVLDITYEYEARTVEGLLDDLPADVFNVYADGNAGPKDQNLFRLRYTGTYEVLTYPELNLTTPRTYTPYKTPYPCSGYIVVGYNEDGSLAGGGRLKKVDECTCCVCWAKQYEPAPQLADNQLLLDNEYRNIKVGEVPINNATFYKKYLIELEQMSMTRASFEYFKLIKLQKENASSLFQSTFGEIIGNIKGVNTEEPIIGLFWATSIAKKTIFIDRTEVPYLLTPIEVKPFRCYDSYPNASTIKPEAWQ
jgi:hypothetical protein